MAPEHQGAATSEAEQRRRFVLMMVVRAVVVSALLGSTIFFNIRRGLPNLSVTQLLLYGLAAAVLVLTAGYALWMRRRPVAFDRHVQIQVIFDVLVATLLVYITGGVESPFTFFFALPIINTAIFFPRRGALLTASLGCLAIGVLFTFESQGILPVELEGRVGARPTLAKVVYLLGFNYAVLFAIGLLAGSLGEQLRRTGRELRETEEEVEALVALNRDIVISLRSGLLALDEAGRVSLLNPVAESIIGLSRAESLGRLGSEVFPPLGEIHQPQQQAQRGLDDPTLERYEVEHLQPDEKRAVPVGLIMSPLRRSDGTVAGTLVHMQDLTAVKAMERSVKKAERLAALGEMAAVLAHEIRNPLASISGSVQMLHRETAEDDREARLMEIILRETKRLDGLLSDFLNFARPKDPVLKPNELHRLIADAVEAFLHRAGDHPPRVETELCDVRLPLDGDQLRQVVWNLLTNADQACGEHGRISVRLSVERPEGGEPMALIAVADDGPGITSGQREKIFEPFFTTKEKGTGLGLATVQQIVEAHGGSVSCDSAAGDGSPGTVFTIRLPGVLS